MVWWFRYGLSVLLLLLSYSVLNAAYMDQSGALYGLGCVVIFAAVAVMPDV
jgi:hypothetical protein